MTYVFYVSSRGDACSISLFAANHAKQDHCSVLLCSNNRSNGKLGITFHRFPVDKYAKENWIVRIRQYVGKNFRLVIVVYDFKLCKLYLKSVCSGLQSNLID